MKPILSLLVLYSFSFSSYALNIRRVEITFVSNAAINISLSTEAEELYYFHTWNYEITGNEVVLNACFVKGFGSTIAYLNNNFEVQISTVQPQSCRLRVNVFYDSFQQEHLQDFVVGFFETPIQQPFVLETTLPSNGEKPEIDFVATTEGVIRVSSSVKNLAVFDESGRLLMCFVNKSNIIDISNISSGMYFLVFDLGEKYLGSAMALRKN